MRRTVFLGGLLALALTSPAGAGTLRAGVGRADITPPTGYYMMGWVRSDAKPIGVWTRLYARVAVLERDGLRERQRRATGPAVAPQRRR
jgi:hypothetical protein